MESRNTKDKLKEKSEVILDTLHIVTDFQWMVCDVSNDYTSSPQQYRLKDLLMWVADQ